MTTLKHDGYYGSVEYDLEDEHLYGKLLYIKALVTYEAETIPELKKAFYEAVADYKKMMQQAGHSPERACSGTFNVRVGHDLHFQALQAAKKQKISLNEFIKKALRHQLLEHTTSASATTFSNQDTTVAIYGSPKTNRIQKQTETKTIGAST